MKLIALVAVLSLAGAGHALQCYSCTGKREISGVSLVSSVLNLLKDFPPCTEFDPYNPQQKFIQKCPTLNDKGCLKVVDPNDSTNVIRSCFLQGKNECVDSACYCTGELCNGSGRGWPSVGLLLAALAAALLGGR